MASGGHRIIIVVLSELRHVAAHSAFARHGRLDSKQARIPTAQQSSQTLPTIAFETLLELLEVSTFNFASFPLFTDILAGRHPPHLQEQQIPDKDLLPQIPARLTRPLLSSG